MRNEERGATLVIIALAVVALLGTAGLAVDGGRIFSARRQAQNATDTAALAGADALFAYQYAAATNAARDASTINTATLDKLSGNATATAPLCQLVDPQGNALQPCLGASDSQLIAASGVQASGTIQQSGALIQVLGVNGYSAHAQATATIQPIVAVSTPFIVCGAAQNGWNFLNPDGTINAAYLANKTIPIQQAQVPDCGAGPNKFKGVGAPTGPVSVGTWENVTAGNGYSSVVANAVAGQTPCPADVTQIPASGCAMIIPIASTARGTTTVQLYIANFAIFMVTPASGTNGLKYQGAFMAPANLALLGTGAFGVHCTAGNQICTAKLSA